MLVMVVFFIAFRWIHLSTPLIRLFLDRKSGSAGMPRPISYAVFCLKKKKQAVTEAHRAPHLGRRAGVRQRRRVSVRALDAAHLRCQGEALVSLVLVSPTPHSAELYSLSLHDALPILTVNAGNGGFLHCIQMDTSVNAANQVVS